MTLSELKQIKQDLSNGVLISKETWLKVLDYAQKADSSARQLLPYASMANTEIGICCCGDSMDRHSNPMDCGHSPVDQGEYVHGLVLGEAMKFLNIDEIDLSKAGL